jgi:glycosyltransferase involved in cell wall biosynthesis
MSIDKKTKQSKSKSKAAKEKIQKKPKTPETEKAKTAVNKTVVKKIKAKKQIAQDVKIAAPEISDPKIVVNLAGGKKPVILQVLPELQSGGVERGTVEIAKAGKKLGYEMIVTSSGGKMVPQLEEAHINHIILPLASKNPFKILRNIRLLKDVIKKYDVDIVHARSRAPAWSAYFAAKQTKTNFITTFHGAYSYGSVFKKIYNSIMTKGEIVIAISDFIRNHMVNDYRIKPEKIRVIPRGVDLEQFTKEKVHKIRIINMDAHFHIELDMPVILLPARFTRWKGHEFLIDALASIKDENFVGIFAGYDKKHENYYHELERRVKARGLFEKVRMIGSVADMPALYSLSDIVISASIRPEAFGRIAIEAQAMEKLVIATKHGGSVETVRDRETGWLVEPGDVEGLAGAIKEALKLSEKQRKIITSLARNNVETNFSMENMVQKTFAVYNEMLQIPQENPMHNKKRRNRK